VKREDAPFQKGGGGGKASSGQEKGRCSKKKRGKGRKGGQKQNVGRGGKRVYRRVDKRGGGGHSSSPSEGKGKKTSKVTGVKKKAKYGDARENGTFREVGQHPHSMRKRCWKLPEEGGGGKGGGKGRLGRFESRRTQRPE